jgi:hypothetical protein
MPLTHVNFQNSKEFIIWFTALFANCGDKVYGSDGGILNLRRKPQCTNNK